MVRIAITFDMSAMLAPIPAFSSYAAGMIIVFNPSGIHMEHSANLISSSFTLKSLSARTRTVGIAISLARHRI